jgi:hypothetical protein
MMSRTRTTSQARHKIAMLLLALTAVFSSAVLVSPGASAATVVRGTVTCVAQDSVVGVWIQAEKGGSGWATLSSRNRADTRKTFQYSLPKGGRYQVHVGCGWKNKYWWGGGKVWKTNNKSGYVSGTNKNFTCVNFKYPAGYRPGSVYNASFYLKCVVA